MEKGLVQVYTGDGKGKTTAAFGQAMRAAGNGLKVFVVQFLKGRKSGELESAERLSGRIEVVQCGRDACLLNSEPTEEDLSMAHNGLELARRATMDGGYDMVVLDEVNVAVELGLLTVEEVLPLIDGRPGGVELVLTGRYAPDEFCRRADLVTEMRKVKHHYDAGIGGRRGIEY